MESETNPENHHNIRVTIRRFERFDIPKKVEWINNPANNRFLHYDIPLSLDKTEKWFESHIGDKTRFDAIIEVNAIPVGIIGLLSIDSQNSKAEYYITIGEVNYKGKGIAKAASRLLLEYAFDTLKLNRIYLYTEVDNIEAQKLFKKIGFIVEGRIRQDVFSHGKFIDRYEYGFLRKNWNCTNV